MMAFFKRFINRRFRCRKGKHREPIVPTYRTSVFNYWVCLDCGHESYERRDLTEEE
jgi:hypothetical protein